MHYFFFSSFFHPVEISQKTFALSHKRAVVAFWLGRFHLFATCRAWEIYFLGRVGILRPRSCQLACFCADLCREIEAESWHCGPELPVRLFLTRCHGEPIYLFFLTLEPLQARSWKSPDRWYSWLRETKSKWKGKGYENRKKGKCPANLTCHWQWHGGKPCILS